MSVTLDNQKLARQLANAQQERSNSLEKLSSGQIFTRQEPRPSERAIAEGLEFRMRSLAVAKRNVNDAVSLLQTADSAMSEINNMIIRMKEINGAAANAAIGDRERGYLFVEYQALFDEITRIATSTKYNHIPLLNGRDSNSSDSLVFRLDAPFSGNGSTSDIDDINVIRFDGIRDVVATSEGLGLRSARRLLKQVSSDTGLALNQVEGLLRPRSHEFSTIYDEALAQLSMHRSAYGAIQARMNQAIDYIDVYHENIAAAKSRIADVDYAKETAQLIKTSIMMHATTGLLAQGQLSSKLSVNLLNTLV